MLLAASVASFWLGVDAPSVSDRGHRAAIVGVLAIAFAKIWLIVRYFMEVRFGPSWLRTVMDAWVLATFSAVALLYVVR